MSIPEVSSRARLVAFLRKFFAPLAATWQAPSYLPFGYSGTGSTSLQTMPIFSVLDQGYRMPAGGTLLDLSFQVTCTVYPAPRSASVAVYKNGAFVQSVSILITGLGDFGATASISPTTTFVTGDILSLKFNHSGAGMTTENWACLLRVSNTTV